MSVTFPASAPATSRRPGAAPGTPWMGWRVPDRGPGADRFGRFARRDPARYAGNSLDCAGWTRCDRHMGIYAVIFRALGVSCNALGECDRNTGYMTPAEGTYRPHGVPSK